MRKTSVYGSNMKAKLKSILRRISTKLSASRSRSAQKTLPFSADHDLPEYPVVLPLTTDKFSQNIVRISGGISVEESQYLRDLAKTLTQGCIVEVGSFRGKSSVVLSAGAADNPLAPQVFCIEPHEKFKGIYGGQFGPVDRKEFYRAMLATGAYENTSLVNLSSEIVTRDWAQPVGLCFIDGDHSYEGVKRDFECWADHVIVGGLVTFDDAQDKNVGPAQLLEELLPSDHWEKLDAVGKFVTLRRKPN